MRKFVLLLLIFALAFTPCHVSAKAIARYATKTVELKDGTGASAKTVATVKFNTKIDVVSQNKTWTVARYNDQVVYTKTAFLHEKKAVNKWPGKKFKKRGRGRWNKCSWTWYSTREYCGKVKGIPGRHVNKKRGIVLDKDGYVCLASGKKNKKKHKVVPTPLGLYGKVYDTNGRNNNKWFDLCTTW